MDPTLWSILIVIGLPVIVAGAAYALAQASLR